MSRLDHSAAFLFNLEGAKILLPLIFCILPLLSSDAVFSSNDYDDVFLPIWSYWHRGHDSWIIILSGDQRENKGVAVYRWDKDASPELLKKSSAREGIFNVRGSALSPSGKRLVLRGFTNPVLFELDLEMPKRFKRALHLELSESFLFWDEKHILSGAKYPEMRFKVYGPEDLEIPQLRSIRSQLPKKMNHPVEPYYYKNKMHLSKNGEVIALAFGLMDKVTLWDGKRRHQYTVGFPGYVKPPWKKPKNLHTTVLKAWFQGFHHLYRLTWFENELYGMYRLGYGGHGVWVKFEKHGARKIWDNNEASVRIFAMERDSLILGQKIVDNDEEVQWRLWQSSSLPTL